MHHSTSVPSQKRVPVCSPVQAFSPECVRACMRACVCMCVCVCVCARVGARVGSVSRCVGE